MKKKLYFELKDNEEMNVTCDSLEVCMDIIESHVYSNNTTPFDDIEGYEIIITPVMLTDEEYEALGESDSY